MDHGEGTMKQRRPVKGAASQSGQTKLPRRPPKAAKQRPAYIKIPMYGILASLIVLALRTSVKSWFSGIHGAPEVTAITPLPAERVADLPQFKGEHRERLFWGTYRPHLYFGLRTRSPKSLLVGLMWVGIKDGQFSLRHTCEESDGLERYGWLKHDGITYGHQELVDKATLLSTSFIKSLESGAGYGGDWAARIKVEGLREESFSSLFFYIHDEQGGTLNLWPRQGDEHGGPAVSGSSKEINDWELHIQQKVQDASVINYAGLATNHMHNFTQLILGVLHEQVETNGRLQLPNEVHRASNTAIFQITGKTPLEVDITFVSGVTERAEAQARVNRLSGEELSKKLSKQHDEFEQRFTDIFHLNAKVDKRTLEVGKAALSNLLGGIGYFYGQSRIAFPPNSAEKRVKEEPYLLYWPAELTTAVPSRSFFPRGFLWDEGFHQLVISRWDTKISMDIIAHWLDLININGWIPREQILGDEARSKVPDEFVLQHTDNANPPALFLVLHDLAKKVIAKQTQGHKALEELEFLEKSFPRLNAWFRWFNTTQIGKASGSYFWHGRDDKTDKQLNPQTLTSGLDDYPRASHPSSDERHVDLRCWMALAAKTMSLISTIVGKSDQEYEATANNLLNLELLNQLHYDEQSGLYYDFGNHTEEVKLQWEVIRDSTNGQPRRILRRAVLAEPALGWIPHVGYVNFFPYLMQMIPPDSPNLKRQLELIRDEKLLWTSYGLRSLATTSSLYMKRNSEHDAPYWRGPVWINLNYLVLSATYYYSTEAGPFKDLASALYQELRSNLIRNIVDQYHETGYLWEQYDNSAEGKGKGSHPFTGWTALILLIMAEIY